MRKIEENVKNSLDVINVAHFPTYYFLSLIAYPTTIHRHVLCYDAEWQHKFVGWCLERIFVIDRNTLVVRNGVWL